MRERERDHLVTLFVNSTGLLAEIDFGSALAIVSVYISENLGSLEETSNPVLVKDPCREKKKKKINWDIKIINKVHHMSKLSNTP